MKRQDFIKGLGLGISALGIPFAASALEDKALASVEPAPSAEASKEELIAPSKLYPNYLFRVWIDKEEDHMHIAFMSQVKPLAGGKSLVVRRDARYKMSLILEANNPIGTVADMINMAQREFHSDCFYTTIHGRS